ncbi:MAG: MmgE/PrpD family protein [Betaproteobacteria bacterium]|nr:MmgE/PrpD family protein [Betaproteobacteria bacterium]
MTIEKQLVRHVRETAFADLPEEVVDAARREVLWALGTSVAGAGAAGSDNIVAFVRQQGGREESTVIGFGDRVPASLAGLANGAFAKALEYEDKFWLDEGHGYAIGTAVVPAALATAEHLGRIDGKALLAAVALATDVQARMVTGAPTAIDTGWVSSYVFSAFGATMVAAKLMGLDEEQFTNAMGLAYAQTTGSQQANVEGVMGCRMQMGFGVRNGITAAQLAKLGVTGVHHFLTGKFGLYPLIFKSEEVDLDAPTRDLGRTFLGTRLGFKAYPCGAVVHPVLDAVLSLMGKGGVTAESIEAVKVFGTTRLWIMVEPKELRQNPKNHVETEFSLPWAVACTIIDGKLSFSHFTDEALRNRRYAELARKVESDMDDSRHGVWVEMKLKDGRTAKSQRVLAAKGHPDNPQSTEEMVERYRECVQYGPKPLTRERTEQAKDMILRLHEVTDVAEIIRLLG